MKKFLAGITVTLIFVAVAAGAYYLGTRKSPLPSPSPSPLVNQYQSSPQPTPPTNNSPTPTPLATPDQTKITDNIIASITSKNYAALKDIMTNPVSMRLEATECCGSITPTAAVAQLSYLDPATNWDFNKSNPIIAKLNTQIPQFYGPNHIVGVASNKYVIGFKLNQNSQISDISLSASYEILITP